MKHSKTYIVEALHEQAKRNRTIARFAKLPLKKAEWLELAEIYEIAAELIEKTED
jgi:hypothetical protein